MSGKAIGVVALFVVIGGGIVVAVCLKTDVQTGEVVTCESCRKTISNTVSVLSVPWWKAKDYHVVSKLDFCQQCGNEPVAFAVHTLCSHCKREYQTTPQSALRRQRPVDTTNTEGSCASCETPTTYKMQFVCQNCGKTYKTDERAEPKWKVPAVQSVRQGYCMPCDMPAPWVVHLKCEGCGKQYRDYQTTAKPRDKAKSEVTVGLCAWCKVRQAAKNLGQRTGEVTGDMVEGMMKGAQNR